MENKKNTCTNDEIDLVELLGMFLKRRRFILIFIALFTITLTASVAVKEYFSYSKNVQNILGSVDKNKTNQVFIVKFENDIFKYAYNHLAQTQSLSVTYDKFFLAMLELDDHVNFDFVFKTQQEQNDFLNKYNNAANIFKNMAFYRSKMSDALFFRCYSLYNNPMVQDKIKIIPDNTERSICDNFSYSYQLLNDKLIYSLKLAQNFALKLNSIEYFINIQNQVKEPVTFNQSYKNTKDMIASASVEAYNYKKLAKFFSVFFVLSIILSIFIVFVLEFLANNKNKLKKYIQ